MRLFICLQQREVKVEGEVVEVKVVLHIGLINNVQDILLSCLDGIVLTLLLSYIEEVCNISNDIYSVLQLGLVTINNLLKKLYFVHVI